MTALEALNIAAPLADTYMEVERRIMLAIARQLTLNDTHSLNEVSKWQIKQLARMGLLKKDAGAVISSLTRGLPEDYAEMVSGAITSTLSEDGLTSMWQNEEFSESAKQTIKHYRNQAVDVYNQVNTVMQYKAGSSYVRAINSVAEKFTEEMRRMQPQIDNRQDFLNVLNSNTAAVVSGTTARTRAVRDTIHEMAQRGIPAFVDKAGREWSPEAYVNMDIRNTVKNTATSAAFGAMDALGQDVFEVSSHAGSRPKCRPWQGKFISRSGKTREITDINGKRYKVYPLSQTSYGEPDGLFGINCGHRPRGVSDGLFTRTAKTSEEYGDNDEELYRKVCKQRELERRVRRTKNEADMLEAAGDTEGAKELRRKLTAQSKELKAYCQQNGLKYRSDRVRTYGAVEPKKVLDKSAGSGIINIAREEMPRKTKAASHAVEWKTIQSKEYSEKFKFLSDEQNVSDAIQVRAKWALNNRDGAETEEMYAVSLSTGEEIGRITNQHYIRGVRRTTSFVKKLAEADARGEKILLIHNHPNNTPPSISDFNELLNSTNASGITVGHGGSLYFYSRPSRKIENIDFYSKLRHFSYYEDEIIQMEKALESLQEEFGFVFRKL